MPTGTFRKLLTLTTLLKLIAYTGLCQAEVYSDHLSVITSSNTQSNAVQSFIIIDQGQFIKEGLKHTAKQQIISQQTPFVITYTPPLKNAQTLEWQVKVSDKSHGTIKVLSNFSGNGRILSSSYLWKSQKLDSSNKDRTQLIFRPKPFNHQPQFIKKARENREKEGNMVVAHVILMKKNTTLNFHMRSA